MARRVIVTLVVALLAARARPALPQEGSALLEGVPSVRQEASLWCWAACGEMVMGFLGHPVIQCRQANDRCRQASAGSCPCQECPTDDSHPCEQPSGPRSCNASGWPAFHCFGFTYRSDRTADGIDWTTLVAEIDAGRPVLFTMRRTHLVNGVRRPYGVGHMRVAVGHAEDASGERFVDVLDPWVGSFDCGAANAVRLPLASFQHAPDGLSDHQIDHHGIELRKARPGCGKS